MLFISVYFGLEHPFHALMIICGVTAVLCGVICKKKKTICKSQQQAQLAGHPSPCGLTQNRTPRTQLVAHHAQTTIGHVDLRARVTGIQVFSDGRCA